MKLKPIFNYRYRNEVKGVFFTLFGQKKIGIGALFLLLTVFFISGWLPDSFLYFVELNGIDGWKKLYIMWIACGLVILTWFVLYLVVKRQQPPLTVSKEHTEKVQILITLLSVPNHPISEFENEIQTLFQSGKNQITDLFFHLSDLHKTTRKFYNWEMPLRSIFAHIPVLQKLYVLTSNLPTGSSVHYHEFEKIVRIYFPDSNIVEIIKGGVDFDDLKRCFTEVDKLVKFYQKPSHRKTIIVDVTGGKVPTSIAASLSTLAYGQKFQYLDTINKTPHQYDVVLSENE